jgi:hypothetical protein
VGHQAWKFFSIVQTQRYAAGNPLRAEPFAGAIFYFKHKGEEDIHFKG